MCALAHIHATACPPSVPPLADCDHPFPHISTGLARVQEAQLMLGFALERGDGTAKSPSEAVEW